MPGTVENRAYNGVGRRVVGLDLRTGILVIHISWGTPFWYPRHSSSFLSLPMTLACVYSEETLGAMVGL